MKYWGFFFGGGIFFIDIITDNLHICAQLHSGAVKLKTWTIKNVVQRSYNGRFQQNFIKNSRIIIFLLTCCCLVLCCDHHRDTSVECILENLYTPLNYTDILIHRERCCDKSYHNLCGTIRNRLTIEVRMILILL